MHVCPWAKECFDYKSCCNDCNECPERFKCYTESAEEVKDPDWHEERRKISEMLVKRRKEYCPSMLCTLEKQPQMCKECRHFERCVRSLTCFPLFKEDGMVTE